MAQLLAEERQKQQNSKVEMMFHLVNGMQSRFDTTKTKLEQKMDQMDSYLSPNCMEFVEKLVAEAKARILQAERELAKTKLELETLRQQHPEPSQSYEDMKQKCSSQTSQLIGQEAEVARLQKEVKMLRHEVSQLRNPTSDLSRRTASAWFAAERKRKQAEFNGKDMPVAQAQRSDQLMTKKPSH